MKGTASRRQPRLGLPAPTTFTRGELLVWLDQQGEGGRRRNAIARTIRTEWTLARSNVEALVAAARYAIAARAIVCQCVGRREEEASVGCARCQMDRAIAQATERVLNPAPRRAAV